MSQRSPTTVVANPSLRVRLDRWMFAEVPPQRLGLVRLLVLGFCTAYVIAQAGPLFRVTQLAASAFRPVGLTSILDKPLPPGIAATLIALTCCSGVLATLGLRYRYSAPTFALLLLWVTSYRNSWGMIFHTENLFVLHAAVLALSPAAADSVTWSSEHRRLTFAAHLPSAPRYGWPLRTLSLITVSTYVVAGVAKLLYSGPAWAGGYEIRSHIAYDAVRKMELGSVHSPLGAWLVQFEIVFLPLAVLTLVLELGAPLALLGGRFARYWCLVAWGFHLNVLLMMAIVFPYPLVGVAYASFFAVERPILNYVSRRQVPPVEPR